MNDDLGTIVAVTGATGGIGRRVVEDLLAGGFKVRLLGRAKPDRWDDRVEFAAVDLAAADPLDKRVLEGCMAVVHLAAHVPTNHDDPASAELCLKTNALGTLKLLTAMENLGIPRLIQTTSANAYAPGQISPSENSPMYPARRAPFYLSSKLVQDVLGSHWDLCRNVAATTLRLSSVYGPGLEKSLLTRFCRALCNGEPIRLANGGSFGADFVDIADVSNAVRMALKSNLSGPLNIASGRRSTLLESARLLLEISNSPGDRLIVEPSKRDEAGFPAIDISKAVTFGYVPTGLRVGLERLYQWVANSPLD